jgi:nickel-dependent lactate racemase
MKHAIQYGKRTLSLTVSDERVAGILAPKQVKELKNVDTAVSKVLHKPIGTAPLRNLLRGKKTALIATVDHTRPSPKRLLLPILHECEQRCVSASIIIATGRHRLMTRTELIHHLGRDILDRCPVILHDPFDESKMVTKEQTKRGTAIRVNKAIFEHDIVIGTGIIEPSYLCGWSGGRKILMPGLAHAESIDNNHFHLTDPDAQIGRLHGNPVSDDAAEFASKLPLHFIVYAVVGPNDEFVRIVAGHPLKAHEAACNFSRAIYKVRRKSADIVISTPGGAPYDCDFVQGKKAVIPASEVVNNNGVIIICAECPDGLGAEPTFIEWLTDKRPAEVVRDVRNRALFSLGAHGANILAQPIVEKNARVILVTSPPVARQLHRTYIITTTRLSQAWWAANLIAGKQASVLFIDKARRLIID